MFRNSLKQGIVCICLLTAQVGFGQNVLLANARRNVAVPKDTSFMLGPFYSSASIAVTAGGRWTGSSGAGTDFLAANRRGVILEDGWDIPIITTLSMHNYLIISKDADLDVSLSLSYEYYPFKTQEDRWVFNGADEGIFARLSSEFQITENIDGTVYWNPSYVTDFVDTRGEADALGGQRYERFENDLGTRINWHFSKVSTIGLGLSRQDVIPTGSKFDNQEHATHRAGISYEREVDQSVTAGVRLDYAQTDYKLQERADLDQLDAGTYVRLDVGESVRGRRSASVTASLGYSNAKTQPTDDRPSVTSDSITGGLQYDSDAGGDASRNIRQSFGYRRSQGASFDSDLAATDLLFYNLACAMGLWDLRFRTEYRSVEQKAGSASDYSNWLNTLAADYNLTKFVVLNASTSYGIRDNKSWPSDVTGRIPLDLTADYHDWISMIGATIALTPSLNFRTYYQHAVRSGDVKELDFTRDTVEALFTYTYRL